MALNAAAILVQHLHGGVGPGSAPDHLPLAATAALYTTVAAAGLLAAPLLTRVAGRPRQRLPVLAVLALMSVALVAVIVARRELAVGYLVGAMLAAAIGLWSALRGSAGDQAASGAGLLAVHAAASGISAGPGHLAVVAAHLVAASVWLGGVLHLAFFASRRADRWMLGAGIRRFTPYAVGSGLVLAGTGAALVVIHHVGLQQLTGSAFGRVVLTKAVLLLAAGCVGVLHSTAVANRATKRRPGLVRGEAGLLATALGLAAVLTGLPLPQPSVQLDAPGLSLVDIGGGQRAALFTVATGPSSALVQVTSDESLRVVDRITHAAHQLDPGGHATVALVGRTAHLALTSGVSTVEVTVPAARPVIPARDDAATADQGGWLSYQLGRALAFGTTSSVRSPVPARCQALSAQRDGAAFAATLTASRVRTLQVVSDGSRRSGAFVRGLIHGSSRIRVPDISGATSGNVLVATGADAASAALARIAHRPNPATAVYLAPWLLDGRVLTALARLRLPPVLVASTVDPMSPLADRYRAALAGAGGGAAPSVAGLLGYRSVVDPTTEADASLRLYAATPIGFLPGVLDAGHDHGAPGWFADGTLVATTAATTTTGLPGTCTALPA